MLLDGRQEGHPASKKYGEDGGGGHWLVRMEWRLARRSVCLPLIIFPCTTKSRSSLLVPAHPGSPGKSAVKRLWCGVVVIISCNVTSTSKNISVLIHFTDALVSPTFLIYKVQ